MLQFLKRSRQQQPELSEEIEQIGIYGDIDERRTAEIIDFFLAATRIRLQEDRCSIPIRLFLSTHGGFAEEMFAIYDVLRLIQKEGIQIHTYGVGKVMSSGVLLFAAGDRRFIGANCRTMLHDVSGGGEGSVDDMEAAFKEACWLRNRYIECLSIETHMSKEKIKKMMEKPSNVYFDAKKAVQYGIADEIF